MKTEISGKTIKIEKQQIDISTGKTIYYAAEVQQERDEKHNIFTLTFEGWQTPWERVGPMEIPIGTDAESISAWVD